MEAQGTRIAHLERRVQQLQDKLWDVQRDRDRAKQAPARTLQKILLRQSAYAMAGIVEAFVYQGEDTGQ